MARTPNHATRLRSLGRQVARPHIGMRGRRPHSGMSVRFVGHDVTVDRSEFLVVWGVVIIAIGS